MVVWHQLNFSQLQVTQVQHLQTNQLRENFNASTTANLTISQEGQNIGRVISALEMFLTQC